MLLQVDGIEVAYGGIHALRGASLAVDRGEVVALLGPNGAGKTTMLRAITGLVRPRRGSIVFDGRDVTRRDAASIARAGVCHVPEGSQVFATLTVEENLRAGEFARGPRPAVPLETVYDLFPVLAERRRQVAGSLSGGEQQMLGVARALVASPVILLLDEPSLGLAPLVTEALFERLRQLKDAGTTMLLAEQNAAAALGVADRIFVMRHGRVVESGRAGDYAAAEDFARAYIQ